MFICNFSSIKAVQEEEEEVNNEKVFKMEINFQVRSQSESRKGVKREELRFLSRSLMIKRKIPRKGTTRENQNNFRKQEHKA